LKEEVVSIRFQKCVAVSVWLFIAACGDRSMPAGPDRLTSNATPVMQDGNAQNGASTPGSTGAASGTAAWSSSSGGSGGTVKQPLTGPAINGVVPEGLATADQSQFSSGGSTILTVTVKSVNLRDGTVLGVSLDFTPVGSITLSGGRGSMTRDLGHFGVSRDPVRVKNGGTEILRGAFFR
jgi:hypothetical protein